MRGLHLSKFSRARAAAWRSESRHSKATARLSTHCELRGTTIRAASGSAAFGRPGVQQEKTSSALPFD